MGIFIDRIVEICHQVDCVPLPSYHDKSYHDPHTTNMAERLIQDWLDVPQNGEETSLKEEKLITELAGCELAYSVRTRHY